MLFYKKRILIIAVVVLILTAGILTWSHFHVSGSELELPDSILENCTAEVTVIEWEEPRTEQELDQEQLRQLIELLKDSSYWREKSDSLTGNWIKTYHIFLNFTLNSQPQYLYIIGCGDHAIRITGSLDIPYMGEYLLIQNENWQQILDGILQAD